jgi:hypothetical protein
MTLVVEQDFAALVRTDNAYKHHKSAYNTDLGGTEADFPSNVTISKLTQLESSADSTILTVRAMRMHTLFFEQHDYDNSKLEEVHFISIR